MTIGYSKEVLYHFSCGECKKWWTVGDWQGAENDLMHCPHCGTQQTVEKLPPFKQEEVPESQDIYIMGQYVGKGKVLPSVALPRDFDWRGKPPKGDTNEP